MLSVALVVLALATAACSSSTTPSGKGRSGSSAAYPAQPWPGSFRSSLLTGVTSTAALSCATPARCSAVAVGVAPNAPGSGGTTSTAAGSVPAPVPLLLTTTDGGSRWARTAAPSPISFLSDISCPASWCVAGGQELGGPGPSGAFVVSADGGRTWSAVPAPNGVTDVTALTCLADRWCLAVGTSPFGPLGLASADAGATWTMQGPVRNGASSATAVSCVSQADCWATTYASSGPDHATGSVLATSDGGATWLPAAALPAGTGFLSGIACTGAVSPGTGSSAPGSPGTGSSAPGSPGTGSSAPASSTSGPPSTAGTTTTSTLPALPGGDCVVTGTTATTFGAPRSGTAVLLTTTDGGSTWTPETVGSSIASLGAVSCPTSSACVATGSTTATTSQAGVLVLTGAAAQPWSAARTQLVPEAPVALSCPALGHCLAAGGPVLERLG